MNLDDKCLQQYNITFKNFIQKYYIEQDLTMTECAKLLPKCYSSQICLECKKQNISIDKLRICKLCDKKFNAILQQKYCSSTCAHKHNFKTNQDKYKKMKQISRKKLGQSRRKVLLNQHNNKCAHCDYTNPSGLCFHHIDSKTKLFTLDQTNLYQKPWNKIELEATKCQLLCQNCHAILHEKERDSANSTYSKGRLRKIKLIKEFGDKCQKCNFTSQYTQCFTFHHINKKDKLFELNVVNLTDKGWENINLEKQKCELLCFNCHMETERNLQN